MELYTGKTVDDDMDYFKRLHECVLIECSHQLHEAQLDTLFDMDALELSEESLQDFGDKTLPDGTQGQLSDNGPYLDFSPLGQKNFMLEQIKEIKQAKDCRILGFLYWDPIFIEVEGMGWELGAKNYVSNTTLFGYEGNRLEVLDAFKYNN